MTRVNGRAPQSAAGPVELVGSPVPTEVSIDTGEITGPEGTAKFVLMSVQSSNGLFNYFYTAEQAEQISNHLAQAARLCRSGIILPSDGGVPPMTP
jgi:hypothetical protein